MDTCIPKIVHYCWFGPKKMPKKYRGYIRGWKKKLPDYTFILWNEQNFDCNGIVYAEQAYAKGKYAFVSDVARVCSLSDMGGLYLDTDVEMIRSPEPLLKDHSVVLGTENAEIGTIGTGFMACAPGSALMREMVEYYKKHPFIRDSGEPDLTPNTTIIAQILREKFGLRAGDTMQSGNDTILYPFAYFTAFNNTLRKPEVSSCTYCVHHFADSWSSPIGKLKRFVKIIISRARHFGRKN